MTYNAHIGFDMLPERVDFLRRKVSANVRLTLGEDVPTDTNMLVNGRPTDAQLQASESLQVLLIPFAGVPAVTQERMTNYPHVAVHNLHHNAAATAELAVGLMMACARKLVPADRDFRKGDWLWRYNGGTVLLNGKTALILGYGQVGRRVGAVCRALGMTVLGVRRSSSDEPDVYGVADLHILLPRAHVLFITLPGTPQTDGLVGRAELELLPKNAILINVGRAAVVDEGNLYDLLRIRRIHSAGLDVWTTYPEGEAARSDTFPSEFPFWELDNVVMSPHRGGAFGNPQVERDRIEAIAKAVNAAAGGMPVPNPVDLSLGY